MFHKRLILILLFGITSVGFSSVLPNSDHFEEMLLLDQTLARYYNNINVVCLSTDDMTNVCICIHSNWDETDSRQQQAAIVLTTAYDFASNSQYEANNILILYDNITIICSVSLMHELMQNIWNANWSIEQVYAWMSENASFTENTSEKKYDAEK